MNTNVIHTLYRSLPGLPETLDTLSDRATGESESWSVRGVVDLVDDEV